MSFATLFAAILSVMAVPSSAAPASVDILPSILARDVGSHCTYPTSYNITSQIAVFGDGQMVTGDFVGPGPTGESISSGYSYSVSYTVTGGVSATFKISDIFSFGVTASFGITTAKGTSLSASVNCPPNVTCGLMARPQMLYVEGTQTMHLCGSDQPYDTSYPCSATPPSGCSTVVWNATVEQPVPFSAYLPISITSSTVDGQDEVAVDYVACTVGQGVAGLAPCPLSGALPPVPSSTPAPASRRR